MRLNEDQRTAIRNAVTRHFGPGATVLLFGSRVDDTKSGGDIDLLVELPNNEADPAWTVTARLSAISDIQRHIGDRKIDLVVATPRADDRIVTHARSSGVTV